MTHYTTGYAQATSCKNSDGNVPNNLQEPISIRYRQGEGKERERVRALCHQSSGEEDQSVQVAIALIQGKWKIGILSILENGPARLSQLRRMFPEASKKMLTQHLREMERDGLIVRTDLSGRLRHVEYSLSDTRGFAILELVNSLTKWSSQYASPIQKPHRAQLLSEM